LRGEMTGANLSIQRLMVDAKHARCLPHRDHPRRAAHRSANSRPSNDACTTIQPIDPSSRGTGTTLGPHGQPSPEVSWSTRSLTGTTWTVPGSGVITATAAGMRPASSTGAPSDAPESPAAPRAFSRRQLRSPPWSTPAPAAQRSARSSDLWVGSRHHRIRVADSFIIHDRAQVETRCPRAPDVQQQARPGRRGPVVAIGGPVVTRAAVSFRDVRRMRGRHAAARAGERRGHGASTVRRARTRAAPSSAALSRAASTEHFEHNPGPPHRATILAGTTCPCPDAARLARTSSTLSVMTRSSQPDPSQPVR
jgi:hypothetical protein